MALIPYPGSKEKLVRAIQSHVPVAMLCDRNNRDSRYIEPFFGAGGVGLRVMRWLPHFRRVWINDIDRGMTCLWETVRNEPEWLIDRVRSFEPKTAAFDQFKRDDGDPLVDRRDAGFRKLALHRMSFSSLGVMAGGPRGGKTQSGTYRVDGRWQPAAIEKEVWRLHGRLSRLKGLEITNRDFREVLSGACEMDFLYLDPPYYDQGPNLYKHAMSEKDHLDLAGILRQTTAKWVLSYDDDHRVRELYAWAHIETVATKYNVATCRASRSSDRELLISPGTKKTDVKETRRYSHTLARDIPTGRGSSDIHESKQ